MASAGRILIMPKGNWKADESYEMLDLVYRNGISWIARQSVASGIEPSTSNSDYWQRMSDEGHKVAFKTMMVECAVGNTDYEFDLSEFEGRTIIGSIHWLGYPLDNWTSHPTIHQKNHSQGVIRTDIANRFHTYCAVFYK